MPRVNFNAAGGGLSRLAAALGGAGNARQDAYDREMERQLKLEQGRAGIERDYAVGEKYRADAGETLAKTGVLQNRPGLYEEAVAANSGVDIPMVQAIRQMMRTGQAPEVPMGPPTETGDMGVGQMAIAPEVRTKVASALQQFLPMVANSGDLNPQQMAGAAETFRNMSLSDAIIAGQADRNRVGGAQAAAAGKDLFSTDSAGGVLDRYVGSLATDNPMAQSTIGLRGAQAGQAKAAAAENYAQAEQARATAELRRKQTSGSGPGGAAPKGYRWAMDATGEMILEAIPGGPADPAIKGPKPMTEAQGKAMLFGSRMQESNELLNGLEAQGVMTPSLTKMAAEEVPLVGGALGMAANALVASPEQQQVEQAQRDFVNAVLRRESGAVIADSEFKNAAKQYFPQPGDDKKTREQKRRNRELAIRGILTEAGPNAPDITDGGGSTVARGIPARRSAPTTGAGGQRNIVVDY